MPITVLISPVFFIQAGTYLTEEDNTKGLILLGLGILFMLAGIIECKNEKENK